MGKVPQRADRRYCHASYAELYVLLVDASNVAHHILQMAGCVKLTSSKELSEADALLTSVKRKSQDAVLRYLELMTIAVGFKRKNGKGSSPR